MKKNFLLVLFLIGISGCTYDVYETPVVTNYPANVEKILINKCSTSGCHNTQSKEAAAGLDLSTWDKMFDGTNNGAVTIPFRPDFSTTLYFTNTDSSRGLVVQPTMPINAAPLSTDEYNTLKSWIQAGAPNKDRAIKFSDNPQRKKYYVANQGCDVVSVFDANSKVVMRMVNVGKNAGASPPESPHNVKVTPDGKYWIVIFLNSDIVQVYSTETDQLVKQIDIGNGIAGGWNTVVISKNSQKAYAVDYNGGRVAFVDLVAGTSTTQGPFPSTGASVNLHGSALNSTDDTLYVTYQESNKLVKIPINDPTNYEDVNLNPPGPDFSTVTLKPHEVIFSPNYSKYFVSCQDVNQVRVFNTSNDQLIKVIPVGIFPLEFAISPSKNLIFVTNTEDNYFTDVKGSLSAIDLSTLSEVSRIRVGWQPHGIAVDESAGVIVVANRNYAGTGPAPHHPAACAGKNGYLSIVSLTTLLRDPKFKPEVSVDPYSIAIRP